MYGIYFLLIFGYCVIGLFITFAYFERCSDDYSPAQKLIEGKREPDVIESFVIVAFACIWPIVVIGFFLSWFLKGMLIFYRGFKDD